MLLYNKSNNLISKQCAAQLIKLKEKRGERKKCSCKKITKSFLQGNCSRCFCLANFSTSIGFFLQMAAVEAAVAANIVDLITISYIAHDFKAQKDEKRKREKRLKNQKGYNSQKTFIKLELFFSFKWQLQRLQISKYS